MTFSFKNVLKKTLGITSAVIFAAGCNDIPTEIGSDFVQDTSVVTKVANSATQPLITGTSVERIGLVRYNNIIKNIGFGNSTILIGATSDGRQAYTFVNVVKIADSLKSVTESQLLSATLLLTPTTYALGDTLTSPELSFTVHALKKQWNIVDTLETIFPQTGASDYYESTSLSEFKGTVARGSAAPVEVNIPKSTLAQWLTSGDSTNGLAIVPSASAAYIQQFKGLNSDLSYAIHIRAIYSKTEGDLDTALIPLAHYGTFLKAPGAAENELLVQNGTSYRPVIDFNLSAIEEFASIHSAKFTIYRKSEFITFPRRRLVLVEQAPNAAGNFNDILASYGTLVDSAAGRYEFTGLGSRVEKWMRGDRKGRLYLIMEGESETADRMTFFGMNADSTLRPRLEIVYSTRPK
jgi:hypothetical protein